jgi:hypothetical protein
LSPVAWTLLLLHAAAVPADDVPNPWSDPDAPARIVFNRSADQRYCLLAAPAALDGAARFSAVRAWAGLSPRPARIVWADATNLFCLVDVNDVPSSQTIGLYLQAGGPPPAPDAAVTDPRPVRFLAQRTAGQDLPASWSQLLMLDSRVDRDPWSTTLEGFDLDDDSSGGWNRGDWQRKNHLIEISSWVLFPNGGRYLFGLRADTAMWMLVDGVPVVECRPARMADWVTGLPCSLSAGLHRVTVRGVTRQGLRLAAGWSLEGRRDAPGVVPVTSGDLIRGRLERRDRRVHALAVVTAGRPYAFQGCTNIFTPLRLESRSVSWDGHPLTSAWRLDGRYSGSGRLFQAVVANHAGAAVRVELEVADGRGATAGDALRVPVDPQSDAEYRVAGRLVGVPAFGYEEDTVRPEIHVRSSAPDDVAFTVEAAIEHAGGGVTNIAGRVDVVRSWGRLPLPPCSADAVSRISWRVVHAGVTLDRGAIAFDREPFRRLPDALDGDSLRAGDEAVMLVARRASAGAAAAFGGLRHGQRLLVLDGFLGTLSTNAAGRLAARLARADEDDPDSGVALRRLDLRAIESAAADGVARLLPLAQAGELLPADVVLLAPCFDALVQGEPPAQFERRLAALTGLLAGAGRTTVVLVAPPPVARLPGCEPAAAALPDTRELAELVVRVADAHGLPVADLYTGFMTAETGGPWWTPDGVFTAAGIEECGTLLRRALFGRKAAP